MFSYKVCFKVYVDGEEDYSTVVEMLAIDDN